MYVHWHGDSDVVAYNKLRACKQFTTRGLGEPLNIIISALSDPFVLEESGLRDYSK